MLRRTMEAGPQAQCVHISTTNFRSWAHNCGCSTRVRIRHHPILLLQVRTYKQTSIRLQHYLDLIGRVPFVDSRLIFMMAAVCISRFLQHEGGLH